MTIDRLLQQANHARRDDRLADAHRDLVEAVDLSRRGGEPRQLVQALKALGQIERDRGNGIAALSLFEEAVALCRAGDDPLALAHTVRHLGDIHREAGRTALAESCYNEALDLYRRNQGTPPLDLANAIRPLAILEEHAGHVAEAKRLWTEARDLYAAVGVQEGVAESDSRLRGLDRPGSS